MAQAGLEPITIPFIIFPRGCIFRAVAFSARSHFPRGRIFRVTVEEKATKYRDRE